MIAVFQTGGKQYQVTPGDEVTIEKIRGNVGDPVQFKEVLMIGENDSLQVGSPLLNGMEVTGEILRQAKSKKILVFKFKRRKKYRKKQGHRQRLIRVKITGIGEAEKGQPVEKEPVVPKAVNE